MTVAGIMLGGDLNIICPNKYLSPVFLAFSLSSGDRKANLSKMAQGKSVVHIHNNNLKQLVFSSPKITEQKQIGTFFKQLDDLIALHQRKLIFAGKRRKLC